MVKSIKPFINIGPGDIIKDYLAEFGWTQNDLAQILGMTEKSINQIINNKHSITLGTAKLLAKVFKQSPQFWINLDTNYRLRLGNETQKEKDASIKAQIRKYMPINEMKSKGWITFNSSSESIAKAYMKFWNLKKLDFSIYEKLDIFNYRARQNKFDPDYTNYYLITWFQYVKLQAKKIKVNAYNKKNLKALAEHLSCYTNKKNGINEFINKLNKTGVKFLIIPHLKKTYLDGACFLDDKTPVIVYTARYNRVDNFWFTIAHEIAHVLNHLDGNKKPILDNLDNKNNSKIEKEADKLASNFLKVNEVINEAIKYTKYFSEKRLLEISNKVKLNPSLVLGILQYNKYVSYKTLNKYKKEVLREFKI